MANCYTQLHTGNKNVALIFIHYLNSWFTSLELNSHCCGGVGLPLPKDYLSTHTCQQGVHLLLKVIVCNFVEMSLVSLSVRPQRQHTEPAPLLLENVKMGKEILYMTIYEIKCVLFVFRCHLVSLSIYPSIHPSMRVSLHSSSNHLSNIHHPSSTINPSFIQPSIHLLIYVYPPIQPCICVSII